MADESDHGFSGGFEYGWPTVWVTPEELKKPTRDRMINLVIAMLESELFGNDDVELICLFLAEDARFNTWFETVNRTTGFRDGEAPALRAEVSHVARRVYEAWGALAVQSEKCGRKISGIESELAALSRVLREEVARLIDIRQGGRS